MSELSETGSGSRDIGTHDDTEALDAESDAVVVDLSLPHINARSTDMTHWGRREHHGGSKWSIKTHMIETY
jgi:hypothetical protein